MSGLFITGTDTEIGKTFVSSLLIKILAKDNVKVAGMKPVASGAKIIDGSLKNDDALSLLQASNINADYDVVNPYVFETAVSPHIAAEQSGIDIDLDKIKNNFEQLQRQSDVVIVEGVGGWYAPLSCHTTVADLAEELKLPVILVVGLRLGCLNHTLLTAQAIRQSGLTIAGWIANHIEEDFSSADENIKTIKHFLNDIPFLGTVSYQTTKSNKQQNHTINSNNLAKYLF